jgi:hypothetical protein
MVRDISDGHGPPESGPRSRAAEAAHFEKIISSGSPPYRRREPRLQPFDLAAMQFCRDVEKLHKLGPRVLGTVLEEIGSKHLIRTSIETIVLQTVRRVTPEMASLTGADQMVRFPLQTIEDER